MRATRLSVALAARGHDVTVATYHLGTAELDNSDPPIDLQRIANLELYSNTQAGPTIVKLTILDFMLFAKVRRLLRNSPFDLIYAHHYESLAIALAARFATRKTSVPIVYDAHTMLENELPHYAWKPLRGLFRKLGGFVDKYLPKRANQIVAVSQTISNQLCRYNVPTKIEVVTNRVETHHFCASQWDAKSLEAQTILFSGNMAPYQGIELLLHCVAMLAPELPKLRLRILSDESFAPYASMAESLGIADIIHCVNADFQELPAHLAAASVAINPRCEGDGIAQKLLNYMAVGIPIVSSAGTAVGLRHNANALVVENENPTAMADAIRTLLSDPDLATRLGGKAREQILANGGWMDAAKEVEASTFSQLYPSASEH